MFSKAWIALIDLHVGIKHFNSCILFRVRRNFSVEPGETTNYKIYP
jgi:hypothetical protein